MKVHVIGSGISGSTAARLLVDAGHQVEVLETRDHIGGNCYDERQPGGWTFHRYGPHLFHTNDENVWRFLSRFTEWDDYVHRVVADTKLGRISIPYNLVTEQQLGGRLSDVEIRELVFVDYSRKQWGVSWEDLPGAITGRVPTRRESEDTRYFTDVFQGQPKRGFAGLFNQMLNGIPVHLGCGPEQWRRFSKTADLLVFTGKIDAYFGEAFGKLPYRSLRFEHERSAIRLDHAVINQCNSRPETRVYDHRWFSEGSRGGNAGQTVVTREFPVAHDDTNDPYYPMPFGDGRTLYQKYKALADAERRTVFLGRLATYSYLDMWMAVAQVMTKLRHNL